MMNAIQLARILLTDPHADVFIRAADQSHGDDKLFPLDDCDIIGSDAVFELSSNANLCRPKEVSKSIKVDVERNETTNIMKWYHQHLGEHVHVETYINNAYCGKLTFRTREFHELKESLVGKIIFLKKT